MKNNATTKHTDPLDRKEKVQQSNDAHIDQDFEGYPTGPAKDSTIHPKTKEERITAKVDKPSKKVLDKADKKSPKAKTFNTEKTVAHNLFAEGEITYLPNHVKKVMKESAN